MKTRGFFPELDLAWHNIHTYLFTQYINLQYYIHKKAAIKMTKSVIKSLQIRKFRNIMMLNKILQASHFQMLMLLRLKLWLRPASCRNCSQLCVAFSEKQISSAWFDLVAQQVNFRNPGLLLSCLSTDFSASVCTFQSPTNSL